jgi:hypothetical protein
MKKTIIFSLAFLVSLYAYPYQAFSYYATVSPDGMKEARKNQIAQDKQEDEHENSQASGGGTQDTYYRGVDHDRDRIGPHSDGLNRKVTTDGDRVGNAPHAPKRAGHAPTRGGGHRGR